MRFYMSTSNDFNRLKSENSQYLTQHKENPVNWWPYGPEALQRAQDENKPIFLSIGYSSCHWCHVMAEESFEDKETAKLMNEHFINIKVDKEEHPDIDQYYQQASQVVNGRGGWPLNVFLTPDMRPYFVGTYFPKTSSKQEVPTFQDVLTNLAVAFKDDRDSVEKNANQIVDAIKHPPKVEQKVEFEGHYPAPAAILNALKNFQDNDFGGYGAEPKFPHFAFYEWAIEQILEGMIPEELGKHIIISLEKMLMGGIYDHARGGIHRYSADKKWLIPHFEKMLYDQAGLLKLLSKASLIYPSPLIFDALIQTIEYLRTEMLSDDGYFFSAQDADSEGIEGLYFSYTADEFKDALISFDESLASDMDTLTKWFQISDQGNFERAMNVISLDPQFKEQLYSPEGWDKVRKVRHALLEERRQRIPPVTDTKGIASWNFQVITALIDVVQYCKIEAIRNAATQLLNSCMEGVHKTFLQMNEEGKAKIVNTTTKDTNVPLFENFVFFAESQLRFYEISGNELFKENGLQTLAFIFKEFYKDGMFYTRSLSFNDSELYENIHTPIYDQSFKSPLGTLILIIRKLSTSEDVSEYLEKIDKTMENLTHLSLQNPLTFGETLRALVYPPEAYRKIEIPREWLKENKFMQFYPHFSVRFAIKFHDRQDDSWQICNLKECELQGKGAEEFQRIFAGDANDDA